MLPPLLQRLVNMENRCIGDSADACSRMLQVSTRMTGFEIASARKWHDLATSNKSYMESDLRVLADRQAVTDVQMRELASRLEEHVELGTGRFHALEANQADSVSQLLNLSTRLTSHEINAAEQGATIQETDSMVRQLSRRQDIHETQSSRELTTLFRAQAEGREQLHQLEDRVTQTTMDGQAAMRSMETRQANSATQLLNISTRLTSHELSASRQHLEDQATMQAADNRVIRLVNNLASQLATHKSEAKSELQALSLAQIEGDTQLSERIDAHEAASMASFQSLESMQAQNADQIIRVSTRLTSHELTCAGPGADDSGGGGSDSWTVTPEGAVMGPVAVSDVDAAITNAAVTMVVETTGETGNPPETRLLIGPIAVNDKDELVKPAALTFVVGDADENV